HGREREGELAAAGRRIALVGNRSDCPRRAVLEIDAFRAEQPEVDARFACHVAAERDVAALVDRRIDRTVEDAAAGRGVPPPRATNAPSPPVERSAVNATSPFSLTAEGSKSFANAPPPGAASPSAAIRVKLKPCHPAPAVCPVAAAGSAIAKTAATATIRRR